ncbi:MAG: nucleotidyltransferase domain-containing protein [Candidatus Sungbacteria bacterium]|nr:nucleotidyltransferase domain-containing protein [Candidatus Sungbacteria bacterium]
MRLEHYPLKKLKKEILDIVSRHLDLSRYRVFFFGSRVTGTGTDRSDVDVGIEGPEPIAFGALLAIREDIERIRTLYKIDIVDFRGASDDFRAVALQHIEIINMP